MCPRLLAFGSAAKRKGTISYLGHSVSTFSFRHCSDLVMGFIGWMVSSRHSSLYSTRPASGSYHARSSTSFMVLPGLSTKPSSHGQGPGGRRRICFGALMLATRSLALITFTRCFFAFSLPSRIFS